jgi:tetratricopeptide (TPR) repeat protein
MAKRMTSAGLTSILWADDIEQELETELEEIHRRIRRRGGMPDDWTVDGFLDEILGDGLLKRVNERLYFMHQSLQEYFTGVYFRQTFPDALVEFTPRLLWDLVPAHSITEVPNHRFVSPLLMMSGLLDDSTKIVEALAVKNPILAAAAASAASRIDGSLLARLEQNWLDLLGHDDRRHRVVGCSCAVLAASSTSRVIRSLVAAAFSPDSYVGIRALGRLNVPDAIALELAERGRSLADTEYEDKKYQVENAVQELQSAGIVRALFQQWRASSPDSSLRRRFEHLLRKVNKSLLNEELQKIRSQASDRLMQADAERVLTESESWARTLSERIAHAVDKIRKEHANELSQTATAMRAQDDEQIASGLGSSDPLVREASASEAVERRLPVGDVIADLVLRYGTDTLVSSLIFLCGEDAAVAKLVDRSREKCYCVGSIPIELVGQLVIGEVSDTVKAELKRLNVQENLRIEETKTDGGTYIWKLRPSSWSGFRPLFQLRALADRLDFYDCSVTGRLFEALARIPGEASLAELWRAVEHDDLNIQKIGISALAKRGDQRLASRLLVQLGSSTSTEFINAALDALCQLHPPEAVVLLDDLLLIRGAELSDVHPIWGPCGHRGWADGIHRILVTLTADTEIQQALDRALASEDPVSKVAALNELSRWFAEPNLAPERHATWQAPERVQRFIELALRDSTQSVRNAAAEALTTLESDVVRRSLTDALSDNSAGVQVAAADALVRMKAQECYGRIAEVMLHVATADQGQVLRPRAGEVLSKMPGGVEPLYQPIMEHLARARAEPALQMIEASLEILPEDANLFWWRGHALKSLGRLDQAADSFQRASGLLQASVITQVLAQTYLELGDSSRAMATGRRGVEMEPGNADAQSILAWSCYKAGEIPEAIEAAGKALDLDPVLADAIWILLLAHLRQGNLGQSRAAFQHAVRVRQLLSPGLVSSFLTAFMKEVQSITTEDPETWRLIEEIKDTLGDMLDVAIPGRHRHPDAAPR